ncbi:MAG: PorV/PorQ family protein [Candidatus Zixiibacteriota bacterium]
MTLLRRFGGVCIILFVSILLIEPARAGGGRTTADFLNMYVDARSSALGGSYAALADNASAAYWNPGGLAGVSSSQVLFSHFAWYQDMTYEYFSVATPLGQRATAAVSASYVNYGEIQGYDKYDNPTGPLASTYDMSTALSFGFQASDDFYLGGTVRYISMALDNNSSSGIIFDIGAQWHLDDISFGAALVNFGSPIDLYGQKEDLPTAVRLGAAVYPMGTSLAITGEVEKRFHENTLIKGGTEYSPMHNYFLRAGYEFSPGQEVRTVDRSISLGVGARFGKSQIDYTFSPSYVIGAEEIHRFTLSFTF